MSRANALEPISMEAFMEAVNKVALCRCGVQMHEDKCPSCGPRHRDHGRAMFVYGEPDDLIEIVAPLVLLGPAGSSDSRFVGVFH